MLPPWFPRRLSLVTATLLGAAACSAGQWPEEELDAPRAGRTVDPAWKTPERQAPEALYTPRHQDGSSPSYDGPASSPVPRPPTEASRPVLRATREDGHADVYRNTYYDFPREGSGNKGATLYDAACVPIAKVTQAFHDQVCAQGSGRLTTGQTVSFAKRDCACAAACPRTGQKICFERLDPNRFPSGRGATGAPITPLRTVAVDTTVIPLGTSIYVPELAGLPRADGSPHDGCFVAEDRGIKVVGQHLDVFTGDPAMTALWNARVPSNTGVHVHLGDPRCAPR